MVERLPCSSFLARTLADSLKVDDLCDFVAGGVAAGHGPDAHDGGEVADAAVQLGQEDSDGRRVARRVDEDAAGLQGVAGKVKAVDVPADLGFEGLCVIELQRRVDDVADGFAGLFFDLLALGRREGVGEVEDDHGRVPPMLPILFWVGGAAGRTRVTGIRGRLWWGALLLHLSDRVI